MSFWAKKRVLQVLPCLGAGGVEQGTIDIVSALKNKGAEPFVACSGGHRLSDLTSAGGTHLALPLASKNPVRVLVTNAVALTQVIKQHRIDLVHARSRAPAWGAYFACLATKTPFVTTFHGTYNFQHFVKKFYNSSMVRGNRVIAISDFIEHHILTSYAPWVDPACLTRIYRGIDTQLYNPQSVSSARREKLMKQWRLKPLNKVFLMPGRLTRWKGQETAIRALDLLAIPESTLVIVGSDQGRHAYRQELLALTRELGLKDRVRIVEHCDDMPAAYSLAEAVIHASTDPEAFGRVVAEGQAMGLPCLVSKLGAPKEIIIDGETGWLLPAGGREPLAQAMEKVLRLTDEQRAQLAQKARNRVKDLFSLSQMCQQTLDVYCELISEYQAL